MVAGLPAASAPSWDRVLRPERPWWDLRLSELWQYRDLVELLVRRDFVAYYKQTILGPVWYVIQPIVSTIVFTIVFGRIAKLSTDGVAPFLFYLAGTTVWGYFSACLVNTSSTFIANAGLFGKVYFPRLCIPVSIVISSLVSFGIRLALFAVCWIYFLFTGSGLRPNVGILAIHLLILLMAGIGLGFGIIVSSLTTKYRDLQQLVSFGVSLLMYATPVIYPLSTVGGRWRWALLLNPMTALVEIFRFGFTGASAINPLWLVYSAGFSIAVLLVGILIFNRVEATFMDTV